MKQLALFTLSFLTIVSSCKECPDYDLAPPEFVFQLIDEASGTNIFEDSLSSDDLRIEGISGSETPYLTFNETYKVAVTSAFSSAHFQVYLKNVLACTVAITVQTKQKECYTAVSIAKVEVEGATLVEPATGEFYYKILL